MIGVLIVPTGIGCEIGGHAGDANPVAKLLASVCDTLIVHPNVVNASDINEMPGNCLYVEGSMLDRFLEGRLHLTPVRTYNKTLLAVNYPVDPRTVNSVNAAKVTLGADIEIVELDTELKLFAEYDEKDCAAGEVDGWQECIRQLEHYKFDALAVQTPITVSKETAEQYLRNGGVNPWGGVEAICSRLLSEGLSVPVAHAPLDTGMLDAFKEVVDPRMAAEMVSVSYLHCVLKGLHKAPRKMKATDSGYITRNDVDFMVSPWGCWGAPHTACQAEGIPIISVRENRTCLDKEHESQEWCIPVENYWEAAGYIQTMKARIAPQSVRAYDKRGNHKV